MKRIFSKKLIQISFLFFTISLILPSIAIAQQDSAFIQATYKKLCSPSFIDDYAGKNISFQALYLGELTLINYYELSFGMNTKDKIFINHRDMSYVSEQTGLGSSDAQMPCFALSIEKSNSDVVFALKKGDIIEIHGVAEKAEKQFKAVSSGEITRFTILDVHIIEIKKINK